MSLREAGGSEGRASQGSGSLLRSLVAAAVLCSAPLLTACDGGFRPLYGSAAGVGGSVTEKLAQVDIGHIPGRVGQRVRNELVFNTTGGGEPLPPKMKLNIAIRESVTSTLVRLDGEAVGRVYNLHASFQLVRISDRQIVLQGTSYARAGFERFTSIFSNVSARENAENRAAKTIAEDLRARLAAVL